MRDIATLIKTPIDRIEEKITRLRDSLKEAEKKLEELRHAKKRRLLNDLSAKAQQAGGIKILVEKIPAADVKNITQHVNAIEIASYSGGDTAGRRRQRPRNFCGGGNKHRKNQRPRMDTRRRRQIPARKAAAKTNLLKPETATPKK